MKRWLVFLLLLSVSGQAAKIAKDRIALELKGSALVEFLEQVGLEVPDTLAAWRSTLKKGGNLAESHIPFSACILGSNLSEPYWTFSRSAQLQLGFTKKVDGDLEGRFVSWNAVERGAQFGYIRDIGKSTVSVVYATQTDCIKCHRTHGPLGWDRPWKNSMGADEISGTHLAFASLGLLLQSQPQDYTAYRTFFVNREQHFDPVRGNLYARAAQVLADVTYQESPLFRLRTADAMDTRVRQLHLLIYSHQLVEKLPNGRKGIFAWRLTRRALTAAVYPELVGALFDWHGFLERERTSQIPNVEIPASKSPILTAVRPGIDNPTVVAAAGLKSQDIDRDPVTAYMAISEYIREKKDVETYHPSQMPTSEAAFVNFEAGGAGSPASVAEVLLGFSPQEIQTLRSRAAQKNVNLSDVLAAPEFLKFELESKTFPSKKEIQDTIELVFKEL